MKKIIIITILFLIPFGASASGDWNLLGSKNTLSIEGTCSGKDVKFELYPAGKGESAYTSNAICKEGKFEFSDDLLRWKSLGDGKYDLIVNDDQKNIKTIEISRPVVVAESSKKEIASAASETKQETTSPELKFLGAFVSLQQAILDMRTWLAESNYPALAKTMIGFTLDGVDGAVSKLSETIMSSENSQASAPIDAQKDTLVPVPAITEPVSSEANVVTDDGAEIQVEQSQEKIVESAAINDQVKQESVSVPDKNSVDDLPAAN
jgi:hypothetical protein